MATAWVNISMRSRWKVGGQNDLDERGAELGEDYSSLGGLITGNERSSGGNGTSGGTCS